MDSSPPGSSVRGDSPGQNTGMSSCSLLSGIFPIQVSNPGLPHGRWILYHLSHHAWPQRNHMCSVHPQTPFAIFLHFLYFFHQKILSGKDQIHLKTWCSCESLCYVPQNGFLVSIIIDWGTFISLYKISSTGLQMGKDLKKYWERRQRPQSPWSFPGSWSSPLSIYTMYYRSDFATILVSTTAF